MSDDGENKVLDGKKKEKNSFGHSECKWIMMSLNMKHRFTRPSMIIL